MNNVQSPRVDDPGIEQRIQAAGKTAPRVTPADILANVVSEHYFTALDGVTGVFVRAGAEGVQSTPKSLGTLTFCVLLLKNGFTVTGESAPASPENFDAQIGRDLAKAQAMNKIWPLMGYALKDRLYRQSDQHPARNQSNG